MDIYVTEKNGDTRHTNDAQELYEEYCELVEGVLETVGIGIGIDFDATAAWEKTS
jgi:hypothetical protein